MGQADGNTTQLQVLLDLAASGDDDAYGELITRASDRLLKLTRKMLRNYLTDPIDGKCYLASVFA